MLTFLTYIIFIQGFYYLLTGLWPIFSSSTFQKVTGPKEDVWLVKTVGAIITVVGSALLASVLLDEITASTLILSIESIIVFMIVDINYVVKKIIPPIYLVDAVTQFVLFILILLGLIYSM